MNPATAKQVVIMAAVAEIDVTIGAVYVWASRGHIRRVPGGYDRASVAAYLTVLHDVHWRDRHADKAS